MFARPVSLAWDLTSSASPSRVWEVFSDTDNFNRIAGFGFRFEEIPDEDGSVERVGRVKVMGAELVWDELPFEYRADRWYRIRRRFRGGPALALSASLTLLPRATGTSIRYVVEMTPRNAATRPLVALELNTRSRKKIDLGLKALLEVVEQSTGTLQVPAPPLSADGEAALGSLDGLADRELARELRQFLREAPLTEQDRIRPLMAASAWSMDWLRVVAGLLEAVDLDVLTMRWDLLCPVCSGAKQRAKTLRLGVQVHCTSCNLRYDDTFADGMSVSFRPAPRVRGVQVEAACIGSPSLQPRVLAQETVTAGDERVIDVELGEGGYRLRAMPPRDSASLRVVPQGQTGSTELRVEPGRCVPAFHRLAAGACAVRVRNEGTAAATFVLERLPVPDAVLTVGRMLAERSLMERLPAGALDSSLEVSTSQRALAVVEAAGDPEALLAWARGCSAVRSGPASGRAVAIFDSVDAALAALESVHGAEGLRGGLASGAVVTLMGGGEVRYLGAAVEDLLAAVAAAAPGEVVAGGPLAGAVPASGWRMMDRVVRVSPSCEAVVIAPA